MFFIDVVNAMPNGFLFCVSYPYCIFSMVMILVGFSITHALRVMKCVRGLGEIGLVEWEIGAFWFSHFTHKLSLKSFGHIFYFPFALGIVFWWTSSRPSFFLFSNFSFVVIIQWCHCHYFLLVSSTFFWCILMYL